MSLSQPNSETFRDHHVTLSLDFRLFRAGVWLGLEDWAGPTLQTVDRVERRRQLC
jgi:hypothetical protein